jgi:hypothetical protein
MANTYIIQRTRVVRIHERIRTRAESESDAMRCVEAGEFETDDSHELDELQIGEDSDGMVIIDIEIVKDDY